MTTFLSQLGVWGTCILMAWILFLPFSFSARVALTVRMISWCPHSRSWLCGSLSRCLALSWRTDLSRPRTGCDWWPVHSWIYVRLCFWRRAAGLWRTLAGTVLRIFIFHACVVALELASSVFFTMIFPYSWQASTCSPINRKWAFKEWRSYKEMCDVLD